MVFINEKPWFEIADVKMKLNYNSMKEIQERLSAADQLKVQHGKTTYILVSEKALYRLAPRTTIPAFSDLRNWVKRDVMALAKRQ